jgi:hypothetical protein
LEAVKKSGGIKSRISVYLYRAAFMAALKFSRASTGVGSVP